MQGKSIINSNRMSMKKLFFLFAFLVGLGISSSVYAQLVQEVTLDSPNTLASKLGVDVGKVTILKVSGPLGAEDFKTMKEQMNMLQHEWSDGVTEGGWRLGRFTLHSCQFFPKQVDASKGSISGSASNDREGSF